ncbi:unnamed protein product, partial [Allacma fusca]
MSVPLNDNGKVELETEEEKFQRKISL